MAVFTWRVTTQSSGAGEFRTKKSQFGDGYSQEVADGLNTDMQTWSVSATGVEADIAPMVAFVRAR